MKSNHTFRQFTAVVLATGMLSTGIAARADVLFNVNSVADEVDDNTADGNCHTSSNVCTLRAAIMQANHTSIAGVIRIALPAGTYFLTLPIANPSGEADGDLNVLAAAGENRISITGGGAASTIINGNQLDGVLRTDVFSTLDIGGVTIRNGHRRLPFPFGGGIYGAGTLTLTDCIVELNEADDSGGGIYATGMMMLIRTSVRSNIATNGGGLYLSSVMTTIRDSTVYANRANFGGGLINAQRMRLIDATVSGNSANDSGGGVVNTPGAEAFVSNASIVANTADADGMSGGDGGGLLSAYNAAFMMYHTLIAGNGFGGVINAGPDCSGVVVAQARSLFGNLSGCQITNPQNASGITASTVGPLQNNGGATPTHALLPGSEAIDASDDAVGCIDNQLLALPTDQRGASRIAGARCDIGAYEFGAIPPPTDRVFASGFE